MSKTLSRTNSQIDIGIGAHMIFTIQRHKQEDNQKLPPNMMISHVIILEIKGVLSFMPGVLGQRR